MFGVDAKMDEIFVQCKLFQGIDFNQQKQITSILASFLKIITHSVCWDFSGIVLKINFARNGRKS